MKITVSRNDILEALGLNHLNHTIELQVDSSVLRELASLPVGLGRIPEQVFIFIRNHEKIAAIKELRTVWGCGLKEAKDVVESIEANKRLL